MNELPRCKLCRAKPYDNPYTGGITMCTGVTCPIYNVPMNQEQWLRLQGPFLGTGHMTALRDAANECEVNGMGLTASEIRQAVEVLEG